VFKANAATIECVGLSCVLEDDKDTCCDPKAKCSTLNSCGTSFVPKSNVADLECAAATCVLEDDVEACCDPKAKCSTLDSCGASFVPKANTATIECAAATCVLGTDRDTCCDPKAKCSTLGCGSPPVLDGYLPKSGASTLECEAATCNAVDDKGTCCDETTHAVKMVTALAMSKDAFTPMMQAGFKAGVAAAADVPMLAVTIDSIESLAQAEAERRRKLLSDGIKITTSIKAKDETAAQTLAGALTVVKVNDELVSQGVPQVTFAEPLAVDEYEPPPAAKCSTLDTCGKGFELKKDAENLECAGSVCDLEGVHVAGDKEACCSVFKGGAGTTKAGGLVAVVLVAVTTALLSGFSF
jgi:hypothetical protein